MILLIIATDHLVTSPHTDVDRFDRLPLSVALVLWSFVLELWQYKARHCNLALRLYNGSLCSEDRQSPPASLTRHAVQLR